MEFDEVITGKISQVNRTIIQRALDISGLAGFETTTISLHTKDPLISERLGLTEASYKGYHRMPFMIAADLMIGLPHPYISFPACEGGCETITAAAIGYKDFTVLNIKLTSSLTIISGCIPVFPVGCINMNMA